MRRVLIFIAAALGPSLGCADDLTGVLLDIRLDQGERPAAVDLDWFDARALLLRRAGITISGGGDSLTDVFIATPDGQVVDRRALVTGTAGGQRLWGAARILVASGHPLTAEDRLGADHVAPDLGAAVEWLLTVRAASAAGRPSAPATAAGATGSAGAAPSPGCPG